MYGACTAVGLIDSISADFSSRSRRMMLITAAMSLPFSYAGTRFAWLNRGLVTGSGLLSVAFGLFVVYQIGFVAGLFTDHPMWSPK